MKIKEPLAGKASQPEEKGKHEVSGPRRSLACISFEECKEVIAEQPEEDVERQELTGHNKDLEFILREAGGCWWILSRRIT